jgi:membrane protein implicated in regulation of membrane protease activity
MWPVEGPDVRFFPWINIVILSTLAGLLVLFWRMWAQFRERTIDPTLDRIGDRIDAAEDRAENAKGRFGRWIDSWRDKSGR